MIGRVLQQLGHALVYVHTSPITVATTGVTVIAAPGAGLRIVVLGGQGCVSKKATVRWLAGATPITGTMAAIEGAVLRVPIVVMPEDTALICDVVGSGATYDGWLMHGAVRA